MYLYQTYIDTYIYTCTCMYMYIYIYIYIRRYIYMLSNDMSILGEIPCVAALLHMTWQSISKISKQEVFVTWRGACVREQYWMVGMGVSCACVVACVDTCVHV